MRPERPPSRRIHAIALGAALVLVLGAQSATAADPIGSSPKPVAHGTALGSADPVLTFAGGFRNPTPLPTISDPDPTVCVFDCQQWRLTVATTHPFLVSIRNGNGSMDAIGPTRICQVLPFGLRIFRGKTAPPGITSTNVRSR